jgi:hypothetical protein
MNGGLESEFGVGYLVCILGREALGFRILFDVCT